jgi:hypothetical protein
MADVNIDEEIDRLVNFDHWEMVVLVAVGFMLPMLIKNTIEGREILSLPDELYGVATMVATGFLLDGEYRKFAGIGAGVYSVDKFLTRIGVKSTLDSMGA